MILFNDYPVMIDEGDISDVLKVKLDVVLQGDAKKFLNDVHYLIYNFCIYQTGNKRLKNRIIKEYKKELENDLKKVLLQQADYLLENDGGVSKWNGFIKNAAGSIEQIDAQLIYTKILSPTALNGLMALEIPLMYAGGN